MSSVLPNEGTVFSIESATPGTYTAIPGIVSIGGPDPEVADIPTTNLASTSHTKRPSKLINEGELEFKIQYDPADATHQLLYTKFGSKLTVNWELKLVDGMTTPAHERFAGFIKSIKGESIEVESNQERTVTIAITGANTRTAGA